MHEWKLRSQPAYLREQVRLRDKGVCSACGVDTVAVHRRLKFARGANRQTLHEQWGVRPGSRRSLWDADHIMPVSEGGGECDLDNMRTLCVRCHRKATAELRERVRRRKVLVDRLTLAG